MIYKEIVLKKLLRGPDFVHPLIRHNEDVGSRTDKEVRNNDKLIGHNH